MRLLFVLDPIKAINPSKDSSAALMEAAQRTSSKVWICEIADLHAFHDQAFVNATPVEPYPWITLGEPEVRPLTDFDCVWMRKDPPVNEAFLYATYLLEVGERNGVRVINRPGSLRKWNEKFGALNFSELMVPTLVSSRVAFIQDFINEHQDVVIKPLDGRAGQGVIRLSKTSLGLKALLELVTFQENLPVMVQRFIPAVIEGDKRILLLDGKPVGAVNRRPIQGDFRSNLAVGGTPEAAEISDKEKKICDVIAPLLRSDGLFFVGIDVIDGQLSEINVTSPTGIREIESLGKIPISDRVIEQLLK